jgi:hypothetical protein
LFPHQDDGDIIMREKDSVFEALKAEGKVEGTL